ncbi:Uncharacterised protein [Vibrio cholerae]|nr:Uncharacterised protein [Vibrio cholerae]CSI38459.1 Uncharacterised protein [Vibrio cholerae]
MSDAAAISPASGSIIPKVPQLVPVANAIKQESTNTKAGSSSTGRLP